MADLLNISSLVSIAATITALGSAFLTVRKVISNLEKKRKAQKEDILREAIKSDDALSVKLTNKIHDLDTEIKTMKQDHSKDIAHLKETYNGEIKFLGQKIEELRSEVRNQHAQLVQLLSKMIDRND
jgi:hypothetical protein